MEMKETPKRKLLLALLAVMMFLPALAFAEETANSGDTAWMLVSTALVFIMFPGLAFFYAGMVRSKNVLSSCMHTFAAMAIIGVQWMVIGYTLAFGGAGAFIGGFDNLFLSGITPESLTGTIPTLVFVMFQGMFAIITPALISGALAERMKFRRIVFSSCCGLPWFMILFAIGSGGKAVGFWKWGLLILPAVLWFIYHPVFPRLLSLCF